MHQHRIAILHAIFNRRVAVGIGQKRAGFAGGVETDNTADAAKYELTAGAGEQTDYEECLACQ